MSSITSTNCCAVLTSCLTGQTLNVALGLEGSSDYVMWSGLVDHIITTSNVSYPGTWFVNGLCCMNAEVDPCLDINACALGSVVIDFNTVTDEGIDGCAANTYKLTNCQTKLSIYTEANLYAYIDSVITIQEQPGCWLVQTGVSETVVPVTLIEGYDDCLCCLGPEPVKYTRVIPKPDKLYYQITQSQCDIASNVKFAEGYYTLFRQLKYGIAFNCDNINLDKLWIKKNLSDLATINNLAECTVTTPPTPTICPEPS